MPNISRKDFFKITGLVVGSAIAAGCGLDPSKIEVPTKLPPTDSPTARPDVTSAPKVEATATAEIMSGYGGEISAELKAKIEGKDPRYVAQEEGLRGWADYWGLVGAINPNTTMQIEAIEDQNNIGEGMLAFRVREEKEVEVDGVKTKKVVDQYWFPPLVKGKPVYEAVPVIKALGMNLDPMKTSKTIDAKDEEFKKQGYGAINSVLDGSVFQNRGGEMVREKGGKVVAYINPETGRWVKEVDWPICTTIEEAKGCDVNGKLEKGEFLAYAKRHDSSGAFGANVVNTGKIYEFNGDTTIVGTHLTWSWSQAPTRTIEGSYLTDKNARPNRRVMFGSESFVFHQDGSPYDGQTFYSAVNIVKYKNPSGKISYLQYHKINLAPDDVKQFNDMAVDWPFVRYVGDSSNLNYDAETQGLLTEWQTTGEIPDALEGKVLNQFVSDYIEYKNQ